MVWSILKMTECFDAREARQKPLYAPKEAGGTKGRQKNKGAGEGFGVDVAVEQ